MSIDIATLGIKFDSSGLVKAQKELDKTSQAGSKFEKTGGLISKSMADAGNSSSKSGGLISKSMSSVTAEASKLSKAVLSNKAAIDAAKLSFERERQAITKAIIAKEKGAEAAYRYSLELKGFSKEQANMLVGLKKQSGAFDDASSSVSNFNKSINAVKSGVIIAAAAIAAGVAAMTTIAISAIKSGAEVSKLSASLNMSAESLTAWQYVSEKTFGSAEKIADVFKDMNDRVGDFASTGGGPLADVMKVTNLNIRELINLAPDEQLLKVYEALDKIDGISKAEKTFYLESLASDASMLTPLLDDNAAGLRKMQSEAKSLGLVIDSIDAEKFAIVNGELSKIGKIAVGAGNAVGTALAPVLYGITKEITDMALGMGGFGDISKKVVDAALVAVGYLANGYQIIEKLLKGIQVAALYVGQKAVEAFAAMGEAGAQVANFVLKPITKIIETISASWSSLLGGLAKLGGDLNPFTNELKAASDSLGSFSQSASKYKVSADGIKESNRKMAISLITARSELIAMGKANPYSEDVKKWYSDSENSLTAQAKAALALKSASKETGYATHTLGKELEATTEAAKATASQFDKEKESLTLAIIAKTQGAEAAYRYSLSLQKIVGTQADLLVSLKRQTGAFDTVKKSVTETISAYESEVQSFTKATLAREKGELAAYSYATSLKDVTKEEAKLLVKLKAQEIAFNTNAANQAKQDEALKARKALQESYYNDTRTAVESYAIALIELDKLKADGIITQDIYNRLLLEETKNRNDATGATARAAEAERKKIADLAEAERIANEVIASAQQKANAAKQAAATYTAGFATEQEKLNAAIKEANALYADGKGTITLETRNRALAAIKVSQDAYNVSLYENTEEYKRSVVVQDYANNLLEELKTNTERFREEQELLNEALSSDEINLEEYNAGLEKITEQYSDVAKEAKKASEAAQDLGKTLSTSLASSISSGDFTDMGKQLRLAFEDEVFSPIIKEELGNFVSAMTNSLANLGNSVSGLFGGSSSLFGEGGAGLSSFFTSDNIYNAIKDIDIGGALDAAFENSGIGSTIGGIVGSIFGPIGSAAGSALGSIIESAFGGSTQKVKTGVKLEYSALDGFEGQDFEDFEKERSFWRGTKKWTEYSDLNSDIDLAIGTYFDTVNDTMSAQAALFGASSDKLLEGFEVARASFSGSDIGTDVQEWADGVADQMYEVVFDEMLGGFQVAGEELADTVTRVLTQMDTVISGFQALDIALDYTALQIAAIADGMVIAAGSIENLQAVMTSYYDTVYTDAEKAEIAYNLANDAVRAFNVELGLSGEKAIDTVEELKAYVEALDVSTAAGQAAMVTAMALAESIGTLSGTAQESVDSISDLVEEIIEVTTEADSFTTAIQSLAEQLYGTAEDAYALELERYAALKAGAESLLDTARGFSDSATSDSTTLSAAQVEYNNQLQAVQGGDVSAIADLQSAATSLKSALDDSYAGGSQATSGTLQIESQLRNLAESLDLQAIEPTAPEAAIEATLTEADRALLADALLTSMQELALAEDKTVADLMAQNGVYITSLADDLGLNLDSLRDVTKELSDSEYSQLESIAERVGLSTLELSKELGVNASSIGASIADNLASLPNVPDDIKSGLAPYLSAIENSNDYATMESNLNALSNYADSLPADIKSQLNGRLIAIRNAGVGTTQGISSLKNMTQSELTNVADSFGVNSESITAAVSGSGDAMLSGLSNMATAYNSNSLDVAESLDINASVVSGAIADSLSSLPNVPDDIKDGLAPYLSAIESSNNYDDLETNLDVLAAYASALPADIKSQLNGRLIAIRNAGVSTVQGLSQLRTLTSKELNAVADGFGVNAQSIEDAVNGSGDNLLGGLADMASAYNSDSLVIAEELGLNASTVAGAISQNLSDLPLLSDDIKNGLAPYLAAIESSNNYDDLERSLNSASAYIESLPADIKDQLKARLESIRNAGVSTVQGINALNNTTAKELSAVASSFGVNSRSIESAVNGSGTELLNGLSAMARAYGAESTKIAEALGINASVVGQAISNNLQALPNLSNDIKGGLAPYLSAIENSNNYASLESGLDTISRYIDTLPEGIKSELNARLESIRNAGTGTTQAVNQTANATNSQIKLLAESFGLNIDGLNSSNKVTAANTVNTLNALATSIDESSVYVAAELGATLTQIRESIVEQVTGITGVTDEVKNSLSTYTQAISDSMSVAELDESLLAMSNYIKTLPDGIQDVLDPQLNWLANVGESTTSAITTLSDTLSDKLVSLAESIGFDFESLIDSNTNLTDLQLAQLIDLASLAGTTPALTADMLGLEITNLGESLADSITARTGGLSTGIIDGLSPYLDALSSATTVEGSEDAYLELNGYLATLPSDIREQLSGHLDGIVDNTAETAIGSAAAALNVNNMQELLKENFYDIRTVIINAVGDRVVAMMRMMRRQNEKLNLPTYAVGSDYIQGDQLAQIHNGEAIFTAAQSAGLRENVTAIMAQRAAPTAPSKPATVTINQGSSEKSESLMSEIVEELKAAKKEIIEMKDNQKAAGFAIAKNTKDSVKLLDKWDVIGLPQEQV